MQRAGYVPFGEGRRGELSFIRRLGTHFFPRFHVYLTPSQSTWKITIHLDQKQVSYRGTSMHSGEYSGELLNNEAGRLQSVLQS